MNIVVTFNAATYKNQIFYNVNEVDYSFVIIQ